MSSGMIGNGLLLGLKLLCLADMATVDLSKCSREQQKVYKRMSSAGKGDSPRSIYSHAFRDNFDRIRWGKRADKGKRATQS